MFKNKNIICLSTHYWDDPWFRKQQFMSRFAKNNTVLYVEPSFSMLRKPHKSTMNNKFLKACLKRISDNLFILTPPRAMPKWSHPVVSNLNYKWFGNIIKQTCHKLNLADCILWIYSPEYSPAVKHIPYKNLVFDLTDDLAAYKIDNKASFKYLKYCIDGLIKESNLVLVTAKTLLEKYSPYAKGKIFFIPNGVDWDLFSSSFKESDAPNDIRSIKKPIIGFVGVLFGFLDYKLIEYMADKLIDCSFVLVGPAEPGLHQGVLSKLREKRNIFFLGEKSRDNIPKYIRSFDVCINPFKVDEVSKSVNPLKVYEYLACGKPVVSTRMKALEQEEIANFISFSNTYDEFIKVILYWLKNDSLEDKELRIKGVKRYSWDNLFKQLEDICESKLI